MNDVVLQHNNKWVRDILTLLVINIHVVTRELFFKTNTAELKNQHDYFLQSRSVVVSYKLSFI